MPAGGRANIGVTIHSGIEVARLVRMTKDGLLIAMLAGLPLAACEHGTDIEGTVVAPVEVQQLFTPDNPGQLFVIAELPTQAEATDSRAVFCMPEAQDRRIAISAAKLECAQEGIARITAVAVPRAASRIDCSGPGSLIPEEHRYAPDSFNPEEVVATGTVDVPVSTSGGGCRDGHVTFTITLAP